MSYTTLFVYALQFEGIALDTFFLYNILGIWQFRSKVPFYTFAETLFMQILLEKLNVNFKLLKFGPK